MPTVKKIVKTSAKKVTAKAPVKISTPRSSGLSVPVYSLAGRASGILSLPKGVFGQKVNKTLLAQALRVYTTNQSSQLGSTKTRGQVEGSTAKIYRQKGTGRARHGAIRAPIFVGGGIVFGPQSRKTRLGLPQKMKKAALISALSSKMTDKNIAGLQGFEKASGKTKEIVQFLKKINANSALIVVDGKADNLVRAVRNIPGTTTISANLINAYEVLRHKFMFITKDAVEKISNPTKETK